MNLKFKSSEISNKLLFISKALNKADLDDMTITFNATAIGLAVFLHSDNYNISFIEKDAVIEKDGTVSLMLGDLIDLISKNQQLSFDSNSEKILIDDLWEIYSINIDNNNSKVTPIGEKVELTQQEVSKLIKNIKISNKFLKKTQDIETLYLKISLNEDNITITNFSFTDYQSNTFDVNRNGNTKFNLFLNKNDIKLISNLFNKSDLAIIKSEDKTFFENNIYAVEIKEEKLNKNLYDFNNFIKR